MKKILIMLIMCLLLCGCELTSFKKVRDEQKTPVKETLTEAELDDIIKNKEYVIVDVRTEGEYNEEHVDGAINISYSEITNDTSIFKDKIVLVYCQSGRRAKFAYETLYAQGFEVYNLGAIDDIDLPKVIYE